MGEVEKPKAKPADALTVRINAKYREVEHLARSTVEAGIELGGLLVEKKEALGHGEWLPWLKGNFEGSERHAQRFMKLYTERDKILSGDPTRVSDLSLREAFKEISARREEQPALVAPEAEKDVTFEDVVNLTNSLRAIRDQELFRQKNYATFRDYLKAEFPQQAEGLEDALKGWEGVVDNPPPELRGARPAEKVEELVGRLRELTEAPELGTGHVVVGRRLQELEERELYKLIGCPTFSRFCREHLRLSRKWQTYFSILVELADIDPFFDIDAFDLDMPVPENFEELDWARAWPLLKELEELTGGEETEED